MNVVFFTIIVPIYNVEQYLEKCIKSVLQQEKADFELLLVNDGSTDNTKQEIQKFIEKYPEKIIYVEKENGGCFYDGHAGSIEPNDVEGGGNVSAQ